MGGGGFMQKDHKVYKVANNGLLGFSRKGGGGGGGGGFPPNFLYLHFLYEYFGGNVSMHIY